MKKIACIMALFLLTLLGCQKKENSLKLRTEEAEAADAYIHQPFENSVYQESFTNKVQQLISENKHTPFLQLQTQKLDRIEEDANVTVSKSTPVKMNGNQIYNNLKDRTVVIGSAYYCNQCPNLHLNNASGFVIHEEGVIVTNYHVIEVKQGIEILGVFVSDYEGNTYPVTNILAASQSNDLAILKIDTQGKKIKAVELADTEMMAEDVYMMGHPFSNTFFMSKGIIGRKYISERDDEVKIAITAEFGQGASGGPIVNNCGQIVAMVSGTHMNYTNGSKEYGDLQMIIKEAIPVSVIWNYVSGL